MKDHHHHHHHHKSKIKREIYDEFESSENLFTLGGILSEIHPHNVTTKFLEILSELPQVILQGVKNWLWAPTPENKEARVPKRKFVNFTPMSHSTHDHDMCKRVRINVSGKIYETQWRSINRYPETLLGNPNIRSRYWNPKKSEFYFERHRQCFDQILGFYQTGGHIYRPHTVNYENFMEELYFFLMPREAISKFQEAEGIFQRPRDQMPKSVFKRKIWLLFEFPDSSKQAKILAFLSISVVCMSIFIFCAETLEDFRPNRNPTQEEVSMRNPFFFVETICIVWFVIELIARILSCPSLVKFFTNYTNVIEALVILVPYLITIISHQSAEEGESKEGGRQGNLPFLRVIRLVRVFRIFKLSRHSVGLRILAKTLIASFQELVLICFFLTIGIILFSSAMYFSENAGHESDFKSIPDAFFWALTTMTIIGYGNVVPKTWLGKLVGSICALAGALTISLPVPVIVANFNFFYHQEIEREGVVRIETYVQGCPYLPGSREEQKHYMRKKIVKVKKKFTFLDIFKKVSAKHTRTRSKQTQMAEKRGKFDERKFWEHYNYDGY